MTKENGRGKQMNDNVEWKIVTWFVQTMRRKNMSWQNKYQSRKNKPLLES